MIAGIWRKGLSICVTVFSCAMNIWISLSALYILYLSSSPSLQLPLPLHMLFLSTSAPGRYYIIHEALSPPACTPYIFLPLPLSLSLSMSLPHAFPFSKPPCCCRIAANVHHTLYKADLKFSPYIYPFRFSRESFIYVLWQGPDMGKIILAIIMAPIFREMSLERDQSTDEMCICRTNV